MEDMIAVLTSFCARLYGKRFAKNKAKKALQSIQDQGAKANNNMQATVCGKIKDASLYSALDATASLMDKVERIYFRERFVKHGDRNELKRGFLKEYGITGRQLNGVIF